MDYLLMLNINHLYIWHGLKILKIEASLPWVRRKDPTKMKATGIILSFFISLYLVHMQTDTHRNKTITTTLPSKLSLDGTENLIASMSFGTIRQVQTSDY